MKYNPKIHNRQSIRLKGYDYTQPGYYFITICTQDRRCLFGEISNGKMNLNDAGNTVQKEWMALPNRFPNIRLHEFVIMPDHFHAIIQITAPPSGQPQGIAPTGIVPAIGDMVGAFKSITTVAYIRGVKTKEWTPFRKRLWERNYWEHIIRDERAFQNISIYIKRNPIKWEEKKREKYNK